MDMSVARNMIRTIRNERDARIKRLPKDSEAAIEQWLLTDEPFINELCLLVLVAVRHHIERELVWMAARVTGDGRDLDGNEYERRVQDERERLRGADGWRKLIKKLKLATAAEWDSSMNTLRLLANSYKHNPSSEPDRELLSHLDLDLDSNYAPLPESRALRKALAASLDLPDSANYCTIADELLAGSDRFLEDVESQPVTLSPVKWGPASIVSFAR